jgi:adenylyltransferase/sulfurtransferase
MSPLSPEEMRRYSRHLLLPEVGIEGQERLRDARVLCVGAGGLGSPLALYLAAAGVGTLGIVDFDRVDESNLQRQVLHGTADIGRPKVESARDALADLNPHVRVEAIDARLTAENALDVLRGWDVVADGTDNFATRYLVNDACVLLGIPNAYGSIFRFEGQASVFAHPDGPCYRCLYPEPPPPGLVPNCAEGGVLGILPGVIGLVQATEAVKLALGIGETLVGRLLLYDALSLRFREMKVRRDPGCPVCGDDPTITNLSDADAICGVETPPAAPDRATGDGVDERAGLIDPAALKRWLEDGRDFLLLDVRNPEEFRICRIEGSELVPLPYLPGEVDRLDPRRETVVLCHTGIRSDHACHFLRQIGFERVLNLRGGIEAWALEVDPELPRY